MAVILIQGTILGNEVQQVIPYWPVNSPHKWPVTRKMFSFDDVIMSKKKTMAFLVAWDM